MSIAVQFSNPQRVFYPGTEVSGAIVMNLESSIKARSVCIFVKGEAHTHWTESETHTHRNADGSTRTETRTITYEATVIYCNGEAVVWSDTPSNDKLLPGQHQFPFRFMLPTTCAPSFEGYHGYIRYQVVIEIDRKWRFNKTNRSFFTVAPTFDLNSIPQAIMPVKDMKCKEVGMIFFRHGKISIETRLGQMGFVPGQVMIVEILIDNGASRPILKAEMKLNQLSRYVAARSGWSCHYSHGMIATNCNHRREEKKIVAAGEKILDIQPKSKGAAQLQLAVPAVVASFNTCPIITVEYYLSVKLHLKGNVNNTVKNSLPILIGTIPVFPRVVVQSAASTVSPPYPTLGPSSPPYPSSSEPSAPSAEPCPPYPTGPSSAPQLPPPSYEESVYGTSGTTQNIEGAEPFAPRYPFYSNLPSAPPNAPPLPEKS